MHYDVFNGDADGIISLIQLRLSEPKDSQLITGVKRDIQLLENLNVEASDSVTVLDISMEKNSAALRHILEKGNPVFYADHHRSGAIPKHKNLQALIDLDANTCTALIIDNYLEGQYHAWAICAAYGDNMIATAEQLANTTGYNEVQKKQLKELGTLINYNGYGSNLSDLHFHPATLYQLLSKYESPFDVIDDAQSPFKQLQMAYQADFALALAIPYQYRSEYLSVFELPDAAWSRRISGVYGNFLANQNPNSAFAVLTCDTKKQDLVEQTKNYLVSLRAPLNNKQGAGDICSQFETGGGRAAAAGINCLPDTKLSDFINLVEEKYAS
ncbi:DHH family phosphoesterase [Psychromonas sp. RZ22]|uniref:DHH family phosphoesterase n=1 Tax=Psychromonas algarum TaxID=2555643 RepID=UPI0010679C81|nr:DHH family phosphoesterase [Psychromonas sp. RZ22]TEW55961.1 DHH family phosphoesterase [Psychromonas sp. RZ22]